ncbi:hypothetical protein QFC22_005799 [Naganishia vaughanmartiniae]|uniref:Uncharacterized protein n=1 Tax=Naganishia vaughanmartiniae TaxID=1424756 RepID=A0ACC2WT46_9TREE|nr:hypothetical protein QFC22_005799 [Naganishia vaughanmartiniae]
MSTPPVISEKHSLYHDDPLLPTYDQQTPNHQPRTAAQKGKKALLNLLGLCVAGYLTLQFANSNSGLSSAVVTSGSKAHTQSICQQSPILTPRGNLTDLYAGDQKDRIIQWLSGAVQIPTEAYDDMVDVEGDERFKIFGDFHNYLEEKFPALYETLSVEKVNTYALAYEWQGSDPSLKPLFLTAHQDVVPVERSTVHDWTHPPFSGHYDGEYIWGRGASDDKTGLISIMSAVELLIESGFKPTRSLVLAYGFDEECGGKVGAAALGKHLEKKYGKDSMFMLVDEGSGLDERYGQTFAVPSTGEKGYLDVELSVATPGGHSSVPPPHTGIGLLALAINELEANPVPAHMDRENPLYSALQCFAHYGNLEKDVKDVLKEAGAGGKKGDKALRKLTDMIVNMGALFKAHVTTTRAVDIVRGGVKVNALPELSQAVINHRINPASSVAELQDQMIQVLQPLTEQYELSFHAFGNKVSELKDARGTLTLAEAYHSALEPAPISPSTTDSVAWNLLSGSAKDTWTSRKGADHTDLIFVPGLGIGNTDTKRYWNLTSNIYRFGYLLTSDAEGIHTVNEHVKADAVVEAVRFMQRLILNADEYQGN